MRRKADHGAGLTERTPDRLLDPEAGVGAEARIEARVVALRGGDEAEIAFTDEIFGVEAPPPVAARDCDDQPEVGLDEVVACLLIVSGDPLGERTFFFGGEES